MITCRENLLRVFRHQEPDWVPVITLADDYNRPSHLPASFYAQARGLDTTLLLSRYFDVDVLDRFGGGYAEAYRQVRYTRTADSPIETERWETPHGTLTRRVKRMEYPGGSGGEPNLVTWFPIEYPIKSAGDYAAMRDVFEDVDYRVDGEAIADRMKLIGDDGVLTLCAPASPLGMCVRVYSGVEHLALAYADQRADLVRLLDAMGESYYRLLRSLADTMADAVISYDDTTTQAISPAMFRELELPYMKRAADILHDGGKAYIHHACGHVRGLLADFRGAPIDGFDGPAGPPVGNTTAAQARQGFGDGIFSMPFVEEYALRSGEPETIRNAVRSMFEPAGSRRNFIVDVVAPPALAVENLWVAVDEAKRLSGR